MKERDYKIIYERFYSEYLEEYIKEIENSYKKSHDEGDAELCAFNSCCKLLSNKTIDLRINKKPYNSIYSEFKNRESLVRDNNLNRLYTKFILPLCESLEIEMNNDIYEGIIIEFAISEASTRVRSWFGAWHTVYQMMFNLNDFSEFELIRNCSYSEGSEIFKKYHKKLSPNSCAVEEFGKEGFDKKQVNNFGILERYKGLFLNLYSALSDDFFDEEDVSFDIFKSVFTEEWGDDEYVFKVKCENEVFKVFIEEFSFAFENFSKANFGKSKLFKTRRGAKLTANTLSKKSKISKISESKIIYLKKIALDLKSSVLEK